MDTRRKPNTIFMFVKEDNIFDPTLEKLTPPCNVNPTLIFEILQPHKVWRYWKIHQAPPRTRGGGAHYAFPPSLFILCNETSLFE